MLKRFRLKYLNGKFTIRIIDEQNDVTDLVYEYKPTDRQPIVSAEFINEMVEELKKVLVPPYGLDHRSLVAELVFDTFLGLVKVTNSEAGDLIMQHEDGRKAIVNLVDEDTFVVNVLS